MLTKIIIIIVMLIIMGALVSGLIFLIRDKSQSKRQAHALTWRIGLSLSLFLFLCIAFHYHWITPHDIQGNQHHD